MTSLLLISSLRVKKLTISQILPINSQNNDEGEQIMNKQNGIVYSKKLSVILGVVSDAKYIKSSVQNTPICLLLATAVYN